MKESVITYIAIALIAIAILAGALYWEATNDRNGTDAGKEGQMQPAVDF